MIETVSPIEFIYTIIAIIGVIVNTAGYDVAVCDYKIVKADPSTNPAHWIIARGHIRRELIRTSTQVVFVLVGFYGMMTPNPTIQPERVLLAALFGLGLLGLEILFMYDSIADRIERHRVIITLERIKNHARNV